MMDLNDKITNDIKEVEKDLNESNEYIKGLKDSINSYFEVLRGLRGIAVDSIIIEDRVKYLVSVLEANIEEGDDMEKYRHKLYECKKE